MGKADCGGLRDETGLAGHNETWKDAHPGMILREVRRLGSRDPVFVLDGVEKARPGLAVVASTVPLTPSHRAARVRSGWRSTPSARRRPTPAAAAQEEGRERGRVHTDWLSQRCVAAVRVERCRLSAFRVTRAVRGDGLGPAGPDATLRGVLVVREPDAFAQLVRRGVGRHRAYGYGMV